MEPTAPAPAKGISTKMQLVIALMVFVGLGVVSCAVILWGQYSVFRESLPARREGEVMKQWVERINAFRIEHSSETLAELVTHYGSGLQIVPPDTKLTIFEPPGGNKFNGEDYVIERTCGIYKVQVRSNGRVQIESPGDKGF